MDGSTCPPPPDTSTVAVAGASDVSVPPRQPVGLRLERDNPFYLNAASSSRAAKKKESEAKALARKLAAAAKKAAAASARAQKAVEAARARAGPGLPIPPARAVTHVAAATSPGTAGAPIRSAASSSLPVGFGGLPTLETPSSGGAPPMMPAGGLSTTPVTAAMDLDPETTTTTPSPPPSVVQAAAARSDDDRAAVAARAAAAAVFETASPPAAMALAAAGSRGAQRCTCTVARMEKRLLDKMEEMEDANKRRFVAFGKRMTAVRLDTTATKSQVAAIKTGMTGMRQTSNAISTAVSRGAVTMRGLTSAIELRSAGRDATTNGGIVSVPSTATGLFEVPRLAPWTKPMVVRS